MTTTTTIKSTEGSIEISCGRLEDITLDPEYGYYHRGVEGETTVDGVTRKTLTFTNPDESFLGSEGVEIKFEAEYSCYLWDHYDLGSGECEEVEIESGCMYVYINDQIADRCAWEKYQRWDDFGRPYEQNAWEISRDPWSGDNRTRYNRSKSPLGLSVGFTMERAHDYTVWLKKVIAGGTTEEVKLKRLEENTRAMENKAAEARWIVEEAKKIKEKGGKLLSKSERRSGTEWSVSEEDYQEALDYWSECPDRQLFGNYFKDLG